MIPDDICPHCRHHYAGRCDYHWHVRQIRQWTISGRWFWSEEQHERGVTSSIRDALREFRRLFS